MCPTPFLKQTQKWKFYLVTWMGYCFIARHEQKENCFDFNIRILFLWWEVDLSKLSEDIILSNNLTLVNIAWLFWEFYGEDNNFFP